jgi:GR25 family glycosyltransferase involved in LPS biosynthesis
LLVCKNSKESFDPGTKINNVPIYVINLEHRKDRKDRLIDAFQKANIKNYKITKAINGKDLDVNKLYDVGLVKNKKLKRGWYGCALSHINIWKDLYNSNAKYALILEDDVIIPEDFEYKMNKLISTVENLDFDVFYVSSNCWNDKNCKNGKYITEEVYTPKYPDGIAGMQAYVVHRKAVPVLLNNVIPITFAIDRVLMDLSKPTKENGKKIAPKLKTYMLKENLINVNDFNDSETEKIV